jgi:tetratricopeptide (TPR) repeat protein
LIRSLAHITAAALVTAAVCVPRASAQPVQLLDVPYLPQSESLCGGAAAAMVMRYWGAADVYADTFAPLVDPAAGGIRAEALLRALHERGWGGDSFRGDAAALQEALRARRPAIVLIEDRPGRFHYVVVVGWSSGRVIVHDPARAPFRVLNERAFTDSWKQSGFWTVVPDPPSGKTTSAAPSVSLHSPRTSTDSDPCARMVDEAVRVANGGDVNNARVTLEAAAAHCPRSASAWRELAGLDALAAEWPKAAEDARRALERDPRDAHASRILATALYLQDDPDGALDAWNTLGEPLIDLIDVVGLERTRYAIAARALGLAPRQMLTRASLAAARRRLAELPSVQAARVAFRPAENGRAQVEAVVLERPLVPGSPVEAAVIALRTLTDRELAASLSSPSGGGEIWTARWRWWEHRPRVALAFDAPAPFGGNWGVGVFTEKQSYAGPASTIEESRQLDEQRFAVGDSVRHRSLARDRQPCILSPRRRGAALCRGQGKPQRGERVLVQWAPHLDAWRTCRLAFAHTQRRKRVACALRTGGRPTHSATGVVARSGRRSRSRRPPQGASVAARRRHPRWSVRTEVDTRGSGVAQMDTAREEAAAHCASGLRGRRPEHARHRERRRWLAVRRRCRPACRGAGIRRPAHRRRARTARRPHRVFDRMGSLKDESLIPNPRIAESLKP